MATQTVEREIDIQTVEQYLENEGWAKVTQVEQPQARKASFFSRVTDALWRVSCGWSFSGFFLPLEPAVRHSKALSDKEKAELKAYLMGFYRT